jgi:hypothetical protein
MKYMKFFILAVTANDEETVPLGSWVSIIQLQQNVLVLK